MSSTRAVSVKRKRESPPSMKPQALGDGQSQRLEKPASPLVEPPWVYVDDSTDEEFSRYFGVKQLWLPSQEDEVYEIPSSSQSNPVNPKGSGDINSTAVRTVDQAVKKAEKEVNEFCLSPEQARDVFEKELCTQLDGYCRQLEKPKRLSPLPLDSEDVLSPLSLDPEEPFWLFSSKEVAHNLVRNYIVDAPFDYKWLGDYKSHAKRIMGEALKKAQKEEIESHLSPKRAIGMYLEEANRLVEELYNEYYEWYTASKKTLSSVRTFYQSHTHEFSTIFNEYFQSEEATEALLSDEDTLYSFLVEQHPKLMEMLKGCGGINSPAVRIVDQAVKKAEKEVKEFCLSPEQARDVFEKELCRRLDGYCRQLEKPE